MRRNRAVGDRGRVVHRAVGVRVPRNRVLVHRLGIRSRVRRLSEHIDDGRGPGSKRIGVLRRCALGRIGRNGDVRGGCSVVVGAGSSGGTVVRVERDRVGHRRSGPSAFRLAPSEKRVAGLPSVGGGIEVLVVGGPDGVQGRTAVNTGEVAENAGTGEGKAVDLGLIRRNRELRGRGVILVEVEECGSAPDGNRGLMRLVVDVNDNRNRRTSRSGTIEPRPCCAGPQIDVVGRAGIVGVGGRDGELRPVGNIGKLGGRGELHVECHGDGIRRVGTGRRRVNERIVTRGERNASRNQLALVIVRNGPGAAGGRNIIIGGHGFISGDSFRKPRLVGDDRSVGQKRRGDDRDSESRCELGQEALMDSHGD